MSKVADPLQWQAAGNSIQRLPCCNTTATSTSSKVSPGQSSRTSPHPGVGPPPMSPRSSPEHKQGLNSRSGTAAIQCVASCVEPTEVNVQTVSQPRERESKIARKREKERGSKHSELSKMCFMSWEENWILSSIVFSSWELEIPPRTAATF